MDQLVVLKFREGNFDDGFPHVMLEIGADGQRPHTECEGRLPPAPDISQLYTSWLSVYHQWMGRMERRSDLIIPDAQVKNFSLQECNIAAEVLKNRLNRWLREDTFRDLRETLYKKVKGDDNVRFIIQSQNIQLWKLPWHEWDLVEIDYPNAEIALSASKTYDRQSSSLESEVRILVILGKSNGIDVETDLKYIYEHLPRATVTCLQNPRHEDLSNGLWQQNWDILLFAGHGENGQIWLNDKETLKIDDLKFALRRAVINGLKLAIFNCCDGLELAQHCENLHIPQAIAMREIIPDKVAHKFLNCFLENFAEGKHFYLAVRAARERLEGMRGEYPCAGWLPVIFQNPAAAPLTWRTASQDKSPPTNALTESTPQNSRHGANLIPRFRKVSWRVSIVFLVVIVIILVVIRHPPEISSGSIILTEVTTDDKKAGIQAFADGNYQTAIEKFQASLQKQPNDPETLIYLNNAIARQNGNYIKIAVGVPIGTNKDTAQEILRGVAQNQNEVNKSPDRINGQLLEVVIGNDNNNKEDLARKVASQFAHDSSILAVVGHNSSDASLAASDVYQKTGLVMISPTSTASSISQIGNYIFRIAPKNQLLAEPLADYIIKKIPQASIAFCGDEKAADNESFKGSIARAMKKVGGKFNDNISRACELSASNFSPQAVIAQATKSGINGLVLYPYVDRIEKAVEVAQANKGQLQLFGSVTLYSRKTLELGKKDVNGLVLSVSWHPDLSPSFDRKAVALWQLGNGHVNWRTALAYDATQVIVTGLKKIPNNSNNTNKREELQKQLRSESFSASGATGTIQFESGDRLTEKLFLIQVQPDSKSNTGYKFALLKSEIRHP